MSKSQLLLRIPTETLAIVKQQATEEDRPVNTQLNILIKRGLQFPALTEALSRVVAEEGMASVAGATAIFALEKAGVK